MPVVELDIKCSICGGDLGAVTTFVNPRCGGLGKFLVEPCEHCMGAEFQRGKYEGYDKALAEVEDVE
jgi:hypothetical protein